LDITIFWKKKVYITTSCKCPPFSITTEGDPITGSDWRHFTQQLITYGGFVGRNFVNCRRPGPNEAGDFVP
jgi:hypothetical protein